MHRRLNMFLLVCVVGLVALLAFRFGLSYVEQVVNEGTTAPTPGITQQLEVANLLIEQMMLGFFGAVIVGILLFYVLELLIYLSRPVRATIVRLCPDLFRSDPPSPEDLQRAWRRGGGPFF